MAPPLEDDQKSVESSVSVVIPTRGRPGLVPRAVRCALGQTFPPEEVIVVMDGPDEATAESLRPFTDSRLKVIVLPRPSGGGATRNAGIRAARGRWTALLDDDDEWLPQKLDLQLQAARREYSPNPIVCCRVIARNEFGAVVWPRRPPRPNEHLSEYLLCQSGLFGGEGLIIPSAILAKTALFRNVTFSESLPRHIDADWLLRVWGHPGVRILFAHSSEPLAVWNTEIGRPRLSNSGAWRTSLAWIKGNKDLVTKKAYASFLLTWASLMAARSGEPAAFWSLLREALRAGKLRPVDVAAHLSIWLIPPRVRRRLTIALDKRRPAFGPWPPKPYWRGPEEDVARQISRSQAEALDKAGTNWPKP